MGTLSERLLFRLSGESVWPIVFTWRRRCEFKGDRRATISGGMRKQPGWYPPPSERFRSSEWKWGKKATSHLWLADVVVLGRLVASVAPLKINSSRSHQIGASLLVLVWGGRPRLAVRLLHHIFIPHAPTEPKRHKHQSNTPAHAREPARASDCGVTPRGAATRATGRRPTFWPPARPNWPHWLAGDHPERFFIRHAQREYVLIFALFLARSLRRSRRASLISGETCCKGQGLALYGHRVHAWLLSVEHSTSIVPGNCCDRGFFKFVRGGGGDASHKWKKPGSKVMLKKNIMKEAFYSPQGPSFATSRPSKMQASDMQERWKLVILQILSKSVKKSVLYKHL